MCSKFIYRPLLLSCGSGSTDAQNMIFNTPANISATREITVLPSDTLPIILDKIITTVETSPNAKRGISAMYTTLPQYIKTGAQFTANLTLFAPLASPVNARVGVWINRLQHIDNGIYTVQSVTPYILLRASDSVYIKYGDIVADPTNTCVYAVSAAPVWIDPTDGPANIDNPGQFINFIKIAANSVNNLTGTLPINQGGTGSTTGTAALTALSGNSTLANLAASGFAVSSAGIIAPANMPFTNPQVLTTKAYVDANTGIKGNVSIAQGGTGATTAVAALTNLAGNTTLANLAASGFTFGANGIFAPPGMTITNPQALATKTYVDANAGIKGTVTIAQGGTGGTTGTAALVNLAGNTTLANLATSGFTFGANGIFAPTGMTIVNPQALATKAYVDANAGIKGTVAVSQGGTGGNSGVTALVNLAGNTSLADFATSGFKITSGGIVAPNNQVVTTDLSLATKAYVDTQSGMTGIIPVSRGGTGGTTTAQALTNLSGNNTLLNLATNGYVVGPSGIIAPGTVAVSNTNAFATKGYVDSRVGPTALIPISQGGTGKTTGIAALTNLSGNDILANLISSGFNITASGIIAPNSVVVNNPLSLATKEYVDANVGITGIVSIAQGGTGSGDGTDALNALAGGTTLTDLIASGITFSGGGIHAAGDIAITQPTDFATKAYVDSKSGILSTVTVAEGGTGATSGAEALANLAGNNILGDLAASGFVFSSTGGTAPETALVDSPQSLATKAYVDANTGIKGTVTVAEGGTGATSGAEALANLAGNSTLGDLAASGYAFSSTDIVAPSTATISTPQSITTKAYVDAQITSSVAANTLITTDYMPIGSLIYIAYDTVDPSCWLYCNGRSVLRESYPMLFAAVGTTYGSADATHFNLPDFRGMFMRGLDDGANLDPGRVIGSTQSATAIADTTYMRAPLESTVRNSDTGEVITISTYIPALADTAAEPNPVQESTAFYKVRPDNMAVKVYIKYADALSPTGHIGIDTNNIISTNINGNITLSPNGTGEAVLSYATPISARGIVPKQYVDGRISNAYAKKTSTQSMNKTGNVTFDNGISTVFATFGANVFTIAQSANYKIAVELMLQNIASTSGCNVNILVNGASMSRSYYQVPNGYSSASVLDVLSVGSGGTIAVSISAVGTLALMILASSRIIVSMA